jgi:hypothetical protein
MAFILTAYTIKSSYPGFVKWYSKLFRNQGSLLFAPPRFDWGEQIIVVTGGMRPLQEFGKSSHMPTFTTGASGVGELLANTLAVRNVTVVVLDVNPIVTENCV